MIFLLYPLLSTLIAKGSVNNGTTPPSCIFPVLPTPIPVIAFINEEAIGCIIPQVILMKQPQVPSQPPKNPLSYYVI